MAKGWSHIKPPRGFSLLEIIIGATLIFLLATIFISAVSSGESGAVIAGQRARATLVAEEGIEAVRNIRDSYYGNLLPGTYGLTEQNGIWTLSGTSDTEDIFTRTITLSTIDSSTTLATVNVSWQVDPTRTASTTLTTQLIDTGQLVPQVKSLQIDVSGGHISAGNRLVGLKLKNIGTDPITLASTTVSWVGGQANALTEIDINGKTEWGPAYNIGYPATNQGSGGTEGIDPLVSLSGKNATPINNFVFDKNINGAYFIIKFIMSDTSSTTVTTPVM